MTSRLESEALGIIRAVMEHDELEWPKIQAYSNALRTDADNGAIISAVIDLLDGMSERRLARRRLFEALAVRGLLDDTEVGIDIASLAEPEAVSDPPPSAPPSSASAPSRRGRSR